MKDSYLSVIHRWSEHWTHNCAKHDQRWPIVAFSYKYDIVNESIRILRKHQVTACVNDSICLLLPRQFSLCSSSHVQQFVCDDVIACI
jgi:hypothetical protein